MKSKIVENISFLSWNIDGLHYLENNKRLNKVNNDDIQNILTKHDIICLVETHCNYNDVINLDGYSVTMNIRPKSQKATKHSGGLAICIKDAIKPGVKFLPITNSEYMWFKLDKNYFNISMDMYVACVYICPANSSFANKTDDIFELLEGEIAQYSSLGNCLICGDFNGRTKNAPDFCTSDTIDNVIDLPYTYVQDVELPRVNSDLSQPDNNGKKLLELCKASSLRIINGRCLGDSVGYFTCFSHVGAPSVIDYMLTSVPVFRHIEYFHVSDPGAHSIHSSLSLHIKTNPYHINVNENDDNICETLKQYKWQEGDTIKYQLSIQKPEIQNILKSFVSETFGTDKESINNAVSNMSNIIIQTANLAGIKTKHLTRKNKQQSTKKNRKWYSNECKQIKQTLLMLSKQLRKDAYNREKIQSFRMYRKMYKKIIRDNKRKYQQNILDTLENFKSNNPRAFWNAFQELNSMDVKHKENPISPQEWIAHFNSLMNKALAIDITRETEFDHYINSNKNQIFNTLNFRIEDSEISKAISNLKINKSGGIDGILNEMLKASITSITPSLNKLFNQILTNGIFPDAWRINTLTPLHKKGSALLPENYRGIAVGSNLAKLFCSVLHNRLICFATENNLIPRNQIGYKKGARTTDHILTLKNIIDKYIFSLPRKYLYACFVDFKSAFDTVWRKALIYKLHSLNIGGNFLNVLQSMYSDVYYCIKLKTGITSKINSNVGVKQGCVLSPTLFNLFLADLPDIFDESCDPVQNLDEPLSCLMFADDIILLSESATGLQKCLDKIHSYCNHWNLTVNTKKTQVVIFNKGGHKFKLFKFSYGNEQLEITQKYCYLGIVFSSCGTFTAACEAILEKSLKAFFKLKQLDSRDNVKLTLKLFDSSYVWI
jgi:hypothetical protein